MSSPIILLESLIVLGGLALLLIDLWTPHEKRPQLGYAAVAIVGITLLISFFLDASVPRHGFNDTVVLDNLALFFKRFFLLAAFFVLLMSVDFADRIPVGISEFYALILFALSGMLFAASANDFTVLFVSLELITVTFYVLTSFQRSRVKSLEAGVKYLIIGAISTGVTVYGIALVYGSAQTTNFTEIFRGGAATKPLFVLGMAMVLTGLAFKISAFPFQIWAPDVYEGSPAPSTAFLAIGSKAAGFVLLLRILFAAIPNLTLQWGHLLIGLTMVTILYGNLCAIPQRNLKRLLGYSSIGNAGYLLLGIAAGNKAGTASVLYYLTGYLFTVLAAFLVIALLSRQTDDEDISILAGLYQRSPLLATSLAMAMISLAGIPPLAGFFGKFLLIKSVIERAASDPAFYTLIAVALFGIVVSFYYYLGVVRAIYWSKTVPDYSPIPVPMPTRLALYCCIAGMIFVGMWPEPLVNAATAAVAVLPLPGL